MVLSRFVLLAFGLPALVRGTSYSLIQDYCGQTFFEGWDFFGGADNLTHGNANFVTSGQGTTQQLAFVNAAGNAIIKVDNTTVVPAGSNRDTVRITTTETFGVGSVWVADMLHVPFGCSVWPAFWSFSAASIWPAGGEIDTFEGVNLVSNSQMTLHTDPGCTLVNPAQSSTLIKSTDCNGQASGNLGCAITDPNPNSYGAQFASAGGGVFVTELATTGVSIWFFSRATVPASLQGNATSIDTSALGAPVANFPATGCSIDKFFLPQNLVFDITLCGDFAGNPTIFAQTCSGNCSALVSEPSNYDNAYFEVKSVKVFGSSGANTSAVFNGTTGSSGTQARRNTRARWT